MADSETFNPAQDFLDEDPAILTDEELMAIAKVYGVSLKRMKEIAAGMSKIRSQIDPDELQ